MKNYSRLRAIVILILLVMSASAGQAFDNTNILVEEAVNHIYQQRYKQAHQVLKRAYEQSPRHPGVHFNLGRLFELTGNNAEALKEYRLAASLDSSMVAARRGIARVTVELKRAKAIQITQTQQSAAPSPAPVITYNPGASTTRPQQSLEQSGVPSAPVIRQPAATPQNSSRLPQIQSQTQRQTQQRLPALPDIPVQSSPSRDNFKLPPLPQAAVAKATKPGGERKAETLLDSGKTDEAIEALQKILENNPDSPQGHFLYGKALSVKGDLFASIKHLEEALRVDDKFYDAYYLLGRNYAKVNLLEDAIKNYQIYYAVRPQASVALEIARIYETMGNPEQARNYYSRANAMNPGNSNLQMRLNESEASVANNLYLRGNHAFTMQHFDEAMNLFSQALATGNLSDSYRREAARKLEVARFKVREAEEAKKPAIQGFAETRRNFASTALKFYQLSDINFRTRFTGPVTVEWRGYISRKINRHGREFLLMIKELSQDELDSMNRDRNDYRLNSHFNNQPVFLLATSKGGFPPFAREGKVITFNGTTDWKTYSVINDLGQSIQLPSFEFISAFPD